MNSGLVCRGRSIRPPVRILPWADSLSLLEVLKYVLNLLAMCLPSIWRAGKLEPSRALRKRQQIGSMAASVLPLLNPGDVVADFGAGTGHLGLLLAWLRPDCHVVLVERKEYSAHHGRSRIARLGLQNCEFFCGGIEEFAALLTQCKRGDGQHGDANDVTDGTGVPLKVAGKIDIGVAMHACGQLTDLALDLCVAERAKFAMCPCCYGQLGAALQRPRSLHFSEQLGQTEFKEVASGVVVLAPACSQRSLCPFILACWPAGADFAVAAGGGWSFASSPAFAVAKQCMRAVDSDRLQWAAEAWSKTGVEQGAVHDKWSVAMGSLQPWSCSPKNNIILGGPAYAVNTAITAQSRTSLIAAAAAAACLSASRQLAKICSPVKHPDNGVRKSPDSRAAEVTSTSPRQVFCPPPVAIAAGTERWSPSLGQRVWVYESQQQNTVPSANCAQVEKWQGVITATPTEECAGCWWVVPELPGRGALSGGRTGLLWWPQFEQSARQAVRDYRDTVEAISKAVPAGDPSRGLDGASGGGDRVEPDVSGLCSTSCGKWVMWWQLSPRLHNQQSTAHSDCAFDNRGAAVEARSAFSSSFGAGQSDKDSSRVGAWGRLNLAVESGGPLGPLRYASVDATFRYNSSHKSQLQGEPQQSWDGLSSIASGHPVKKCLEQLLISLQEIPALPVLRRHLDHVHYFDLGSRLILVLGYKGAPSETCFSSSTETHITFLCSVQELQTGRPEVESWLVRLSSWLLFFLSQFPCLTHMKKL
eukprot:SAG31_NODE_2735_length_5170_cov_5.478407_3_plen_758_part_00